MEIKYNKKLNSDCFISSVFGIKPILKDLGSNYYEQFNINPNRLGRFILCFNELAIRTSSNILATKSDFFKPCALKDFQRVCNLKDQGFREFLQNLESNDYVKVSNGVIYINPIFALSFEIDYIREELYEIFPNCKKYFDNINKILYKGLEDE
jgi:hypothetical protein